MFVCEKGVVCGCLGVWEELVVVCVRGEGGLFVCGRGLFVFKCVLISGVVCVCALKELL